MNIVDEIQCVLSCPSKPNVNAMNTEVVRWVSNGLVFYIHDVVTKQNKIMSLCLET